MTAGCIRSLKEARRQQTRKLIYWPECDIGLRKKKQGIQACFSTWDLNWGPLDVIHGVKEHRVFGILFFLLYLCIIASVLLYLLLNCRGMVCEVVQPLCGNAYIMTHMWKSEDNWLSLSTFMWVPRIKPGLPRLLGWAILLFKHEGLALVYDTQLILTLFYLFKFLFYIPTQISS